jgi:hypothetical protein
MSDHRCGRCHDNDRFFDVPRITRTTGEGDLEFPILYYDNSALFAFMLADRSRVATLLAGTGLRPALTHGGKAIVGLAFFEYRETSIAPYNEVGLTLPVYRVGAKPAHPIDLLELFIDPRRRQLGFYIIDLPVTTSTANVVGREVWGYPKFVTEIPLSFGASRFEGSVLDPQGQLILTLAGDLGPGLPLPGFDLLLYSELEGRWLRTVVDVDSRFRTSLGRSLRLTVGPSKHRMADNLRALGLDGARPLLVQATDRFRSRLNLGDPVV